MPMPNLIHTRFDWLKRRLGDGAACSQHVIRDNLFKARAALFGFGDASRGIRKFPDLGLDHCQ